MFSSHVLARTTIANRAPQILGHLVQILEQLVEAHLREVIGVRIAAQGSQGSVDRLEIGIVVADVMNLPVRVCARIMIRTVRRAAMCLGAQRRSAAAARPLDRTIELRSPQRVALCILRKPGLQHIVVLRIV